ncbi:MAG: septum formation initiator family protein [Flavobacteriaceae bacterium]|nr:septum formation initiator family protein [Mangrovimonas sp.]MCB0426366.1 septum formation initiator family protein [Mangrovimonas sp.]MCB0436623.1 septum formation initiator family protein [Mangrovimonas sp.]MCB0437257.1 septum formation initiator family protein [Mangrovimonas sp.]HPF96887.1 septum formation initiator family protein [Mangrovimonas sp.]
MAKLNKKYLKPFKNIYFVTLLLFIIWMLFWDSNSWLIHHELNKEMDDLKDQKEYYNKEIQETNKAIKELSNEEGVEKLAREEYYMKKENEDIFIVEYEDSLKSKEHE